VWWILFSLPDYTVQYIGKGSLEGAHTKLERQNVERQNVERQNVTTAWLSFCTIGFHWKADGIDIFLLLTVHSQNLWRHFVMADCPWLGDISWYLQSNLYSIYGISITVYLYGGRALSGMSIIQYYTNFPGVPGTFFEYYFMQPDGKQWQPKGIVARDFNVLFLINWNRSVQ
jgi:hypothetical protein